MDFLFKDNQAVEDLNKVPEAHRALYVEGEGDNEGKFVLDPKYKGIAETHDGLVGNLSSANAAKKKANDEAANRRVTQKAVADYLGELGVEEIDEEDPLKSLRAHIDSLNEQIKGGKEAKVNMDKVQEAAEKRVQEANEQAENRIAGVMRTLRKHLVGDQARAAIAEQKGAPELLMPLVEAQTKIVQNGEDDDGRPIYEVAVVDSDGDRRMNTQGGHMTVADLVQELKSNEKYARAFESETPIGTGTAPGSGKSPAPRQRQELSSTDKIAEGLKRGQYRTGAGGRAA